MFDVRTWRWNRNATQQSKVFPIWCDCVLWKLCWFLWRTFLFFCVDFFIFFCFSSIFFAFWKVRQRVQWQVGTIDMVNCVVRAINYNAIPRSIFSLELFRQIVFYFVEMCQHVYTRSSAHNHAHTHAHTSYIKVNENFEKLFAFRAHSSVWKALARRRGHLIKTIDDIRFSNLCQSRHIALRGNGLTAFWSEIEEEPTESTFARASFTNKSFIAFLFPYSSVWLVGWSDGLFGCLYRHCVSQSNGIWLAVTLGKQWYFFCFVIVGVWSCIFKKRKRHVLEIGPSLSDCRNQVDLISPSFYWIQFILLLSKHERSAMQYESENGLPALSSSCKETRFREGLPFKDCLEEA